VVCGRAGVRPRSLRNVIGGHSLRRLGGLASALLGDSRLTAAWAVCAVGFTAKSTCRTHAQAPAAWAFMLELGY
jgi:hypothetical protein